MRTRRPAASSGCPKARPPPTFLRQVSKRRPGRPDRPLQAAASRSAKAAWASSSWPSRPSRSSGRVALKIIKPGMDTRQVIARFEAERQAAGDDGPSEHRQSARRRHDRQRPALLRHGAGERRADHEVLRRTTPAAPRAAGAVRAGLPGGAARPSEGHHPSRHQAQRTCSSPSTTTSPFPR